MTPIGSSDRMHPHQTDQSLLTPVVAWPRLSLPSPPDSLTSFVGRANELAAARDLFLRQDARLVTLAGPGGIGKSRLAREVAADIERQFADGVAWISLAAITDATLVLPSIVRGFGISDSRGRRPIDALTTVLGDRQLLLVLDNFEQVVAAAPQLTDVLIACPRLAIMVTSRSVLRVQGEHVLPVPPLGTSPPVGPDEAEGSISEAVDLFVARATATAPGIRFDPEVLRAAGEICRRVDGLPLAIELAAARVTHLPIETLRDRMDHRLPLLTGGARDLPARQRTLRDAIAWSYDLLPEDEQMLLRQLSVFAGDFSLDAAEVVSRGVEESRWREDNLLLDLVGSLVDKSLVRHEPDIAGRSRYQLLETIREFAAERLGASEGRSAVRAAHGHWVLALAERVAPVPFMPLDGEAIRQLEIETGNVRAALEWWDGDGDDEGFIRLVASLGWFWWARGSWLEGRPWLERAWERVIATAIDPPVALSVAYGVILTAGAGELDEAERVLTAGLIACRRQDDALGSASLLVCLGWVNNLRGHYRAGMERLQEALREARAIADPVRNQVIVGTALNNLGGSSRALRRYSEARAYHEEALALLREAGAPLGVAQNLFDLGLIARDLGDFGVAEERLREGLRVALLTGGPRYLVMAFEGLASVSAAAGTALQTARLLGMTQHARDLAGMVEDVPIDRTSREEATLRARQELGDGAYDAGWAAGYACDPDQAMAEALEVRVVTPASRPAISLTRREREILPLLVAGLSDREIAAALFIGERTVESHVGRIYAKLGVRNRAAAVAAAIAAGLVDPAVPDAADRTD